MCSGLKRCRSNVSASEVEIATKPALVRHCTTAFAAACKLGSDHFFIASSAASTKAFLCTCSRECSTVNNKSASQNAAVLTALLSKNSEKSEAGNMQRQVVLVLNNCFSNR